jgi:hypothetical protein
MANLILDEWLWSDLSGENGQERQRESFRFIKAIYIRCDRIVTVKNSPFETKAKRFLGRSDATSRPIVKFCSRAILFNSDKFHCILEQELCPVPNTALVGIKPDDSYLVEAYYVDTTTTIVSTDEPLIDKLKSNGVNCEHRDEFVTRYLATVSKLFENGSS